MSAPRPVDVAPVNHVGPSAADIAGRVAAADPVVQAQVQAKISFAAHQKHVNAQHAAAQQGSVTKNVDVPASSPTKVTGFAIVKAVPSADTLVLVGAGEPDRPPPEKTLILAGLIVPRLTRRKDAVDEPYAFQAKEYLRRLVIGKRVKFAVTYVHESGREFGTAELEGVGDLSENLLANGWAKLKPSKEGAKPKPEQEPLIEAQTAAAAAHKGVHAAKQPVNAIRKLDFLTQSDELRNFFNENRGKELKGIVDQVREGSSLRIEVPGAKSHQIFIVHLAGAQSPRIPVPRSPTGSKHAATEKPEEFALDAQRFTADRLLHRDVSVQLLGCDKFGNLFGIVSIPQGNIAIELLRVGLAKYIEWSASLTPNKSELAAAEAQAKAKKLRLWRKFTAPEPVLDVRGKEFVGKVVQIISGDVLVVEDSAKKEHRLSLASVQAPRLGYGDNPSEPWAVEAKEWLRQRLIGKKVRVRIEYVRTSDDREDRAYASVFHGKEDIAILAVQSGLISVTRHRMDQERSSHYDQLQSAEEDAIAAKKGIHGSADPKSVTSPLVDLSKRTHAAEKALTEEQIQSLSIKTRQFFSVIQRAGKVKGVVDFVFNGGRIKIAVPSKGHIFTFMLGGIRLPGGRNDKQQDPLAKQATEFIRQRIFQQNVEVEVESMDKGENYIGNLYTERKNLALLLLERGLARIVPASAKQNKYCDELFLYEQAAQKARVGIWKDYDPDAEKKKLEERERLYKEQRAEEERAAANPQSHTIVITEAYDPCCFYFQIENDPNVANVKAALKALPSASGASSSFQPKRGDGCLAQFEDGTWHRAKVEKALWGGKYFVNFIDYGNRAEVDKVRPLPEGPAFRLPPLAKCATLSGIKTSQDYLEDAIELFGQAVWGVSLYARTDAVDHEAHKAHLTLTPVTDPATGKPSDKSTLSINEQLLKLGVVRVPSRPLRSLRKLIDQFKLSESAAKSDHKGIWEYGDVSSDEDEDNAKDKARR